MERVLTTLQALADTLYGHFVMPGELLLSQLYAHAPALAAKLGLAAGEGTVVPSAILSLLIWMSVALIVLKVVRLTQNCVRLIGGMFQAMSFRMSLALHNTKSTLTRPRQLFPRRRSRSADAEPEVEFDDLDLAVLRAAKARGQESLLSSRELAKRFRLRPAEVQRSLRKLAKYKLLDSVMDRKGSVDNYRLTESGSAILAMWQRQESSA